MLTVEQHKTIHLCWIPSHVGIPGNEAADRAAKAALNEPVTEISIHYSDFKSSIKKYIDHLWQERWSQQTENKLYNLKPEIKGQRLNTHISRRDEIVLSRLRIGHTHYTHAFLLKGEEPPQCAACQCPLTVKHILLECADFLQIRSNYYDIGRMKELFDQTDPKDILGYLKEIGLFRKM